MLMLRKSKAKQRFLYNFDKFFRAVFCACGQSFVLIFCGKMENELCDKSKMKKKAYK